MAASHADGRITVANQTSTNTGGITGDALMQYFLSFTLVAWASGLFGYLFEVAYHRVATVLARLHLAPAGYGHGTVRAHNMVGTVITFGIAIMIAIVMMVVVGMFVANAPTSGAYQSQINTTIDVGGAGFVIVAVTLLVIPVVGLIAYFYQTGLGGMVGGGGLAR